MYIWTHMHAHSFQIQMSRKDGLLLFILRPFGSWWHFRTMCAIVNVKENLERANNVVITHWSMNWVGHHLSETYLQLHLVYVLI